MHVAPPNLLNLCTPSLDALLNIPSRKGQSRAMVLIDQETLSLALTVEESPDSMQWVQFW